jgi:DNA-binding NarL/FixJ family response regulator
MTVINTLLVTRSHVYKEALMRMLERDRLIRAIVPSDFVLPLPPAGVDGKKPFVVLYDLAVKKMSFTDYATELERRHLQARILLYGDEANDEELLFYMSRGAHGFLLSDQLGNLLVTAIKHVAAGSLWMPHKIVAGFVEKVVSEFSHVSKLFRVPCAVSPREQEVWTMINQGRGNKEIGDKLRITERTVKFHVSQLLSKLQVTNRRELMLIFRRSNIDVNQLNALDSAITGPAPADRIYGRSSS